MGNSFTEKLLARFEGREDLGGEGLYEKYFKAEGLDRGEVLECFSELEFNFRVPAGILRPTDSMRKLTDRVTTNNPFVWFLWLGRNEFAGDDLVDELNIRLRKYGTFNDWKQFETVEDVVRAWCGKKPKTTEMRLE